MRKRKEGEEEKELVAMWGLSPSGLDLKSRTT
jgi:hypothetical protein